MDDFLIPTGLTPEKDTQIPAIQVYSPESALLFYPTGSTPERLLSIPPLDTSFPQPKRVRRCLHERFAEMTSVVEEYVKSTGYKAAQKRDSEAGCAVGARMKDVAVVAVSEIGGLDSISPSTVRRLMVAPNKTFKVAKYYHGLIEAKRPANENSARETDPDFHAYSCRVRLICEFGAFFAEDVLMLSVDNKNKIMAGETAVDRRTRHKRVCPQDDTPNTRDHNFSFGAHNKFTPMGYMVLFPKGNLPPTIVSEIGANAKK